MDTAARGAVESERGWPSIRELGAIAALMRAQPIRMRAVSAARLWTPSLR